MIEFFSNICKRKSRSSWGMKPNFQALNLQHQVHFMDLAGNYKDNLVKNFRLLTIATGQAQYAVISITIIIRLLHSMVGKRVSG
jgi:hypothetical protein